MSRRALLLVNRKCRLGLSDVSEAVALLEAGGVAVDMVTIDDPRQIAATIRARHGTVDLVILGGGDGTLNSAAEALMDADLPMGILPMGTANDLARTLSIPTDIAEACRIIVDGRHHRIDVGCVNGKLFFNVASIGLPVEISRQLTPDFKRKWGVLSYAIAAIHAIRHARPFRAHIECDGEAVRLKTVQISVGNGRHYGGGMTVDEDAAIDDGRLHLYSLRPRRLLRYLLLVPALRAGTHKRLEGVLTLSGRQITVSTRRARAVNTDGELTTWTPARFDVLPAVLSVFVPERYLLARQGGDHDAAGRSGSRAE